MRNDERSLIEWTQRWERDRRSREAAGLPDAEETTAEVPQALSKNELRHMLKRDRAPKKGDQK